MIQVVEHLPSKGETLSSNPLSLNNNNQLFFLPLHLPVPSYLSHHSASMDFPVLDICYKGNHKPCSLFYLASLT
jgi:hypothetical protein